MRKKNKECSVPTRSVCDAKCISQRVMDMHLLGGAHQKYDRQAKLVIVSHQFESGQASLAAAASSPDSALYSLDDPVQSQNNDH